MFRSIFITPLIWATQEKDLNIQFSSLKVYDIEIFAYQVFDKLVFLIDYLWLKH
jgi:hypothetical protein